MSRRLLKVAAILGLFAGLAGCDEGPVAPPLSALTVFGWELTGTVTLNGDSVVPSMTAINRSGVEAVPPIYNDICGVDLRVYAGAGHDVLVFDGLSVRGCLDIGYGISEPPGGEVQFTRPLGVQDLLNSGLEGGTEYRMVAVVRKFGDLFALELPDPVLISLP